MELKLDGGNLSENLEFRKTHGSNYFWGYLENKTLNMYGPIFQKDHPPGKSLFFNTIFALIWVTPVIAVGTL